MQLNVKNNSQSVINRLSLKIFKKIINSPNTINYWTCRPEFNLTAHIRKALRTCPPSTAVRNSLEEIINIDRSAFTWKNKSLLSYGYFPLGVEEGLRKVRSKTIEIGLNAKKNDHKMLLVSYPWPAQIAYEQSKLNWTKFLGEICSQLKSTCIGTADVTNAIKKISKKDPNWYTNYYVNGDVHLNPNGNEVMSKVISFHVKNYFNKK